MQKIKLMEGCLVRRQGKAGDGINHLLQLLTVGGPDSPDPRAKWKNDTKFIEIIGCYVDYVDLDVDLDNSGAEPYFTTQICQFREILPKDTELLESFKLYTSGRNPSKKQLGPSLDGDRVGAGMGGRGTDMLLAGGRVNATNAPGVSPAVDGIVDGADGKSAGPPQEIVVGRGTDMTLAGGRVNATKAPGASPAVDGIVDGADGKSAGPPQEVVVQGGRDTGQSSRDRGDDDGAFPKKTRSQNVNRKNNISENKKKCQPTCGQCGM